MANSCKRQLSFGVLLKIIEFCSNSNVVRSFLHWIAFPKLWPSRCHGKGLQRFESIVAVISSRWRTTLWSSHAFSKRVSRPNVSARKKWKGGEERWKCRERERDVSASTPSSVWSKLGCVRAFSSRTRNLCVAWGAFWGRVWLRCEVRVIKR